MTLPETSRRLTSFDAQFLAAESGNMTSNYCAAGIFGPNGDGKPLTLARVREVVAANLDRLPSLSWHLRPSPLRLDHPTFVRGAVDLDHHVVTETLDPPGDEAALPRLTGRLLAQPLDRRRPLWQFHVVEGLPGERTALLMRLHHVAADALAFAAILVALLDDSPTAAAATRRSCRPTTSRTCGPRRCAPSSAQPRIPSERRGAAATRCPTSIRCRCCARCPGPTPSPACPVASPATPGPATTCARPRRGSTARSRRADRSLGAPWTSTPSARRRTHRARPSTTSSSRPSAAGCDAGCARRTSCPAARSSRTCR